MCDGEWEIKLQKMKVINKDLITVFHLCVSLFGPLSVLWDGVMHQAPHSHQVRVAYMKYNSCYIHLKIAKTPRI